MPRLKRRSKNRMAGFTSWHRHELEYGHAYEFIPHDEAFHGDREAMQVAWQSMGSIILREWIAKHPGTRCWAWWAFDAPERRQCLNGPHPFDRPDSWRETDKLCADMQRRVYSLSYGCPSLYGPGDFDCQFESQPDYLDRLGLLSDHEQAALRDRVTPPEGTK